MTTDTRVALDAALDSWGAAEIYAANGGHERADVEAANAKRAAVDGAIAAHVEAEVARRLAAAPEVEAAIEAVADLHAAGGRGILDAEEIRFRDDSIPSLRAAIAADKARAVAAAWRVDTALLRDALRYVAAWGCVPGGSEEWKARNQERVEDALRAAIRGAPPRPTPDEARRLADEVLREGVARGLAHDRGDASEWARIHARIDTARTALLRALGVEP